MKKGLIKLFGILLVTLLLVGCGDKVNKDSALYKAKENMINEVDNYSLEINITTKTVAGDVSVTGDCKEDRKNEISYCKTTTLGVGTESYSDYKNKKSYTRITSDYGIAESAWETTEIADANVDQWLDLNDFIYDVKETTEDGKTKYSGTINTKKLMGLLGQFDLGVDIGSLINKDVAVEAYISEDNHIESMHVEMEILGVGMDIDLTYSDYNSTGSVVIPDYVK